MAAFPDLLPPASAPLDRDDWAELRLEAGSQSSLSDLITIAEFSLDADGALRGRRQVSASGPGAALARLHQGAGLEMARRAVGSSLSVFPTRASYLYYAPGDFALLHHDVTQCTVTLLASLSEGADPLYAYPSFGRASEADVPHLNAAPFDDAYSFHSFMKARVGADRISSFPLEISSEAMIALPGRDLLHARYPQDSPVSVLALCYSALTHRPSWSAP